MTIISTKFRTFLLGALCLFGALAAPDQAAKAQDALKIVAVVNEDVVTELDLFMRMRLAMLSARLNDTPETRQRLLPTLLRTMIDERLKSQEAKRQGIPVNVFNVLVQRKSVDDVRVIFQLINAYLYKKTVTSSSVLNVAFATFLMAPFNIMGEILGQLAPKNPDLYLDNIVLAHKRHRKKDASFLHLF